MTAATLTADSWDVAGWRELEAAGVQLRVALPVGNLLWTMIRGRVDLRLRPFGAPCRHQRGHRGGRVGRLRAGLSRRDSV